MRNIVFLILVFAVPFSANATENMKYSRDIRDMCESRYYNDFEMQKYCINKQEKALQKFKRLQDEYGNHPDLGRALGKCMARYNEDGMDYEMIVHCFKKQQKAYNSL